MSTPGLPAAATSLPGMLPGAVTVPAPGVLCLADCPVGHVGVVASVREGGTLRRRLMELGFVPGTMVRIVRRAPLRDPLEVELHGYHLSLRRTEALAVQLDAPTGVAT